MIWRYLLRSILRMFSPISETSHVATARLGGHLAGYSLREYFCSGVAGIFQTNAGFGREIPRTGSHRILRFKSNSNTAQRCQGWVWNEINLETDYFMPTINDPMFLVMIE